MQGILQGSCFFIDFLRGFHEEREAEFTMKGYTPQKKDNRERRRVPYLLEPVRRGKKWQELSFVM